MRRPFLHFRKDRDQWYIHYFDLENKRHASPTGHRLKGEATLALQKFVPPDGYRKEILLLSDFHDEFNTYAKLKYTKKSQKHFSVAMRLFIAYPEVGDKPLTDVTVKDCQMFIAKVEKDTSIWSARKYYTALASMFERAKQWKKIEKNIWREVEKPKEGEREVVFFERETFAEFMKVVKEQDKPLYTFAVHTGMRLAEINNARWIDINWKKNHIRVVNRPSFKTKNQRSRNIPMSKTLHALLKGMEKHKDSEFIFGYKDNTVSQYFGDYIDNNQWLDQRLHFHSLRHTFASWLVQAHVPLMEVQKLLGHAKISTTEIYAHLMDDTLHDAVSVLD